MRLPNNLLSGGYEQPEVFLCQIDKSVVGGLNVTNFSGRFKFNSYDEITFDVDRTYIDHNGEYCVNPLYDYVESPRVIYVVNFGYFEIIQSGIVTDGLREYKQCVCYSYEFILSTKYLDLFTINMGTVESIDGVQLYNTADISKSLIHLVLEKTNGAWTPGHVDINLQTRQRSFEINHTSIYDFLMNDVSDTFKCIFEFDTVNNVVNIYDEETYGQYSGVYINKDNLAQNISVDYNGDEIKTCLYVYGDSDLDIRAVNLGLPYIMNLDYYFAESWMGKDLYDAYYAYCQKAENKKSEYDQLLDNLYKCYDEYYELYNDIPEYYEDDDIPVVNSKDKLPTPSEKNVFEIYKVSDGEKSNYYICKVSLIDGKTTYKWVMDVDANIGSYLTLPEPSEQYAGIVVKIPNESSGISYYICKVNDSPSDENNWTTTYHWVEANNREGIKLLKEKEQCYLDIQSVHVSAGWAEKDNANYNRYKENYNKLIDIQRKISTEEQKVDLVNKKIETIEANMGKITSSLQLNENFSQEQIIALTSFVREDEYTDSNFLITEYSSDSDILETKQQLKEAAQKELKKISQPQLSFKMDMANLLAIPEFEPVLNSFQLGNYVLAEIRPDYVIKTQLLEVEIGFDTFDFNATFGNLTSLTSQIDMHAALMSQAVSAGKSVAQSSSYWKKGADTASSINSRIERGLIDAVTSLKTDSINQAISYDSRGIHLRRYKNEDQTEYEDEQVWMNNEKIVFTDDGWQTAKMALGKITGPTDGEEVYGIIAPNIVGTLLAGENLVIDSVKGDGTLSSFRVDSKGTRLYNSTFLMEKETQASTYGQIMIDPAYGIIAGSDIYTTKSDGTIVPKFIDENQAMIRDDNSMPTKSNFFLDIDDGSAYFRGIVYANGGFFNGEVTATSGVIGGCTIVDGQLKITDVNIDGKISFGTLSQETQDKITGTADELNTFLTETYINDLQKINNSMDKKAETWYQDTDPSTAWTDDYEKENHLGDLWHYTGTTGNVNGVKRTKNSEWVWRKINNVYQWVEIEVSDDVFDQIDGKAQIFTSTPTPPYFEGDLWVQGSTGDIKHCIKGKASNEKYDEKDWVKSSKYTDDSSLNIFISGEYADDLETIGKQIDGKADTYYQATEPHAKYENVDNNETYNLYVGDLWYDTDNGKTYIYQKTNLGNNKYTYEWKFMDVPNAVFDKIDGIASIYVTVPTNPVVGDLLIPATDIANTDYKAGKVYRYNGSSWNEVAYTDDSALKTFISGEYADELDAIHSQIDKKAETWYQSDDPSIAWTTDELKNKHVGDLWYDTDVNKSYIYGEDLGWHESDVPQIVYDKIDGIATIYTTKPSTQNEGDLLIPNESFGRYSFVKNNIYRCTKSSSDFNYNDWVLVSYNDDVELHNFIKRRYSNYLIDIAHQEDLKAAIHPYGRYDKYRNLGREHHGDLFITEDGNKLIYEGGTAYSDATNEIPSYLFSYGNNYTEDNGVNNIFVALPDSQRYGDLFIPNLTVTIKFLEKKVYKCTKTSDTFNPADWVEVDYTDDTKANEAYDKANSALSLADTAKALGDTLVNGLGFKETEITGSYVISPVIAGGYLLIGDETGVYAEINTDGKLTCTGASIGGNVNISQGSLIIGEKNKDASGNIISTYTEITDNGELLCNNATVTGYIKGGHLLIGYDGTSVNNTSPKVWHQSEDPSDDWTDDDLINHVGDLWHKTSNDRYYVYEYNSEDLVYEWVRDKSDFSYAEITSDGVLYCKEANISGHINATSGTIGGCEITDGILSVPAGKITAGTIDAEISINSPNIYGGNIYGGMFYATGKGADDGAAYYIYDDDYESGNLVGYISYDTNGTGATDDDDNVIEAKNRVIITSLSYEDKNKKEHYIPLKLNSASNMSLEANGNIYMMSDTQFNDKIILQSSCFGKTLPTTGKVYGRLFFKLA